jgi:hypothetical protein
MSDYLVSKLEDTQFDSVEDKNFDSLDTAEAYAKKTSQHDDSHSYAVKKKVDDYEYETSKIYKLGKIITEIK